MDPVRREIVIRLTIREPGGHPLGRTLVAFSAALAAIANAIGDGVVIEKTDVRGRELPLPGGQP